MVEQKWLNSNGGTVMVEQNLWNSSGEKYWWNSSGGTVMVKQKWWNSYG